MTDQTIYAFVHESKTTRELGGYVTFLTVQIATADLTRIDPARPIEIRQGGTDD